MFRSLGQKIFAREARLRFEPGTWQQMIAELHRRGEERREAGAFLLCRRQGNSRLVSRVVYLDDIDPKCLVGGIHLHGDAYPKLWDICDEVDMRVLGDIHTHPESWTGQSSTDRDNPMIASSGHIALIVPNFAAGEIKAKHVGVHEYRGEEGWNSHFGRDARRLLYVGRFA